MKKGIFWQHVGYYRNYRHICIYPLTTPWTIGIIYLWSSEYKQICSNVKWDSLNKGENKSIRDKQSFFIEGEKKVFFANWLFNRIKLFTVIDQTEAKRGELIGGPSLNIGGKVFFLII